MSDDRKLVGYFAADTDDEDALADAIIDAIAASLPAHLRPIEDRPGREPDENGRVRVPPPA